MIGTLSVLGIGLFLGYLIIPNGNVNPRCDLQNPNNDIKHYYGLEEAYIPFGNNSAEKNANAPLFKLILQENIDSSSIIVIGKFGTGKTHIRIYRINQYDKERTQIIQLFNKKIDKYLEIYLLNGKRSIENINNDDIMNMIMSEIVESILIYDVQKYKDKFKELDREDRNNLVSLMILYSDNRKIDVLNNFVSEALFEDFKCNKCHIADLRCGIEILAENTNFLDKLNNFLIYNNEKKEFLARSLYCIKQKTGISFDFIYKMSKKTQISVLIEFYKKVLNKKLVVVIDSLDESVYLFEKNQNPNLNKLQAVVDSILHEDLLTLALGNNDDILLDILVFMPDIPNLEIKWKRIDKIPLVRLDWNSKLLHSYADFILYNLRQQQKKESFCKPLPDFNHLLDEDKQSFEMVLGSLRHPRDLHIFMNSLFDALNKNIKKEKPFIATRDVTKIALENAKVAMFKPN